MTDAPVRTLLWATGLQLQQRSPSRTSHRETSGQRRKRADGPDLAGPRRSKIAFAGSETGEVRSFSQMIQREGLPEGSLSDEVGPRKGWGKLEVSPYRKFGQGSVANELEICKVVRNARE